MTLSVDVDSCAWRELYTAAILESDAAVMLMRIAAAEREIVKRARSLFGTADNSGETDALDDALYALRALKNCHKFGTGSKEEA